MSPLRRTPVETLDDRARPGGTAGQALDVLLAALVDDDPEVRRRAVQDLVDRSEALEHLIGRVGAEPDRTVRDALCTHLARHDRPEVADGLIQHLASDDAGLRTAVVKVLTRIPNAMAARVPELLADPDSDVRILTVMVLAELRLPDVEGWLTELVLKDPNPNVVAAALDELVLLAGAGCEQALTAASDRFPLDPFILFSVRRVRSARVRERQ